MAAVQIRPRTLVESDFGLDGRTTKHG
jgi:hypothetical protein